jgi:hypothetical protein
MAQSRPARLAKGMRVITVQQPWATLIALGEHPVEHRDRMGKEDAPKAQFERE